MRDTDYAYAVARVRANEYTLFTRQELEQLLTAKTAHEAVRTLVDRGFGGAAGEAKDADELLRLETERIWAFIREIAPDFSLFETLWVKNDYHNLKAELKSMISGTDSSSLFMKPAAVEEEILQKAAKEHRFDLLPPSMQTPAAEAYEVLVHAGDGQLCDVILDRAALVATADAAKRSKSAFLQELAEITVAAANLKVALRAAKTGKTAQFLSTALAPCKTLDVAELSRAAVQGVAEVLEYITHTNYAPAVDEYKKSPSAFEKWFDDMTLGFAKKAKYTSFGIDPLVAYVLAKEAEIKSVRIIISGKNAGLPEDTLRERLRELYE